MRRKLHCTLIRNVLQDSCGVKGIGRRRKVENRLAVSKVNHAACVRFLPRRFGIARKQYFFLCKMRRHSDVFHIRSKNGDLSIFQSGIAHKRQHTSVIRPFCMYMLQRSAMYHHFTWKHSFGKIRQKARDIRFSCCNIERLTFFAICHLRRNRRVFHHRTALNRHEGRIFEIDTSLDRFDIEVFSHRMNIHRAVR